MNRRSFVRAGAGGGALLSLGAGGIGGVFADDTPATASSPRIAEENAKPGAEWQLARVRHEGGRYRSPAIEGYCSRQSVKAGETLAIYVSTRPASAFTLDIFRMGYYGGAGARLMSALGPFDGFPQPEPEMGERRLMECRWEATTEIEIPDDWLSGVYLGRLTTIPDSPETPYWQSYVVFVVRDDRRADVLFQVSDNTWQAYNQWPVAESLYTDPRAAHAPDVSVSFDRPYGAFSQPGIVNNALSTGSGEFLLFEFPLAYWLEARGYDVTYCSNVDNLDPANLSRCKAFLSVGHDEYWDLRQFHNVQNAIEEGDLNVLWLSANSVYMVSPFTPSGSGQPDRVITRETCYGEFREEEQEAYAHILGPFENPGPDEREIIGARTVVPFNGGGDWTCTRPGHWMFEGTGMEAGESIPGLIGWEYHGDPDPDRAGLEVVAEGNVWASGTRLGRYAATIFPGGRGNFVFNATTIFWSQGLSSPPGHLLPWSHWSRPLGPDPRVQRITANLLERAIAGGGA